MPLKHHLHHLELLKRAGQKGEHERAVRVLARTIFRLLTAQGYQSRHVIQLSSELIHLVTLSMRELKQGLRLPSASPPPGQDDR